MPDRMRTRFTGGLLHGTLLKRSRQMRKDSTPAEIRLWSHLRMKNLDGARFRRQYQIEGFIVDFCCIKEKLIVEVDGSQHLENVAYDNERTRRLKQQGFRVLRFWNGDVMQNVEGVVEVIFEELGARRDSTPTCAASVSQIKGARLMPRFLPREYAREDKTQRKCEPTNSTTCRIIVREVSSSLRMSKPCTPSGCVTT